jgi:hypothetical protein
LRGRFRLPVGQPHERVELRGVEPAGDADDAAFGSIQVVLPPAPLKQTAPSLALGHLVRPVLSQNRKP